MYENERQSARSVRHPALRPWIGAHDLVLDVSEELVRAASFGADARKAALSRFREDWHQRISPHLAEEDELLLPLIRRSEDRRRLQREHRLLREMALRVFGMELTPEPDAVWVGNLGARLGSHVRWEETTLFPRLERVSDGKLLEELRARLQQSARRREPGPTPG